MIVTLDPWDWIRLAFVVMILLLAWLHHKLETAPPRDWYESDWYHKLGRLVLIAAALGLFGAPIVLFLLR
jgi:hypothetical protein